MSSPPPVTPEPLPAEPAPAARRFSLPRLLSFAALVAVVLFLGFIFFRVIAPFLLPLFLAVLLVVMFRPVHEWILVRCNGRPRVAAALTTLTVLLIVLAPLAWACTLAVKEGAGIARRLDVASVQERLGKLRTRLGLEMPQAEDLHRIDDALDTLVDAEQSPRPVDADMVIKPALERIAKIRPLLDDQGTLADSLTRSLKSVQQNPQGSDDRSDALVDAQFWFSQIKEQILGPSPIRRALKQWANPSDSRIQAFRVQLTSSGQRLAGPLAADTAAYAFEFLLGLVIMIVALYYFLADGPALMSFVRQLSPLDSKYEGELLAEFDEISRAVVLATLLGAIAQGVLAGLAYWVLGFEAVFLLTLATILVGLIPFVGASILWIPAALWLLFFEERMGAAIGLTVWGVVAVSTVDNIVKPIVLHGRGKLHPLLALLSILGGAQALGAIGIFVGPMVVAFLQALINIMHRELATLSGRGWGERLRGASPGREIQAAE